MNLRASVLLIFAAMIPACKTTNQETQSELHSDHIDGPATTAHSITDLTDLYVFPTPEKSENITVVLNVHPLSRDHNHFSDKVDYSFYLRKVKANKNSGKTEFITSEDSEKTIVCKFTTPHDHTQHTMSCNGLGIGRQKVIFNSASLANPSGKFRIYHGLRADPFFFYSDFANSLASEGKMIPPEDNNIMTSTNTLSIVLQFDPRDMFGSDVGLLGIAAQSHTRDENGKFQPLDRLGRPEVTNVTMVAHAGALDLRNQYNLERPFRSSAAGDKLYRQRIIDNLKHYDAIDGKINWSQAQMKEYADIIVNDFLLIDVTKPPKSAGYFTIESELLAGKAHTSFGGRRLEDDIMDKLFGILINRNGSAIADGVNRPEKSISQKFPYLAEPDRSWQGAAKATLARWRLGSAGFPE